MVDYQLVFVNEGRPSIGGLLLLSYFERGVRVFLKLAMELNRRVNGIGRARFYTEQCSCVYFGHSILAHVLVAVLPEHPFEIVLRSPQRQRAMERHANGFRTRQALSTQ